MANQNWYQRLLRLEPGITLGTWLYDRLANNWQSLVTAFVAAGGMTYLATITGWVREWGPFGIGLFGLASGLSVWVALAWAQSLRAKARLRRIEGSALEKWKEHVDHINPLENAFHKKRIQINDVVHPVMRSIKGKKFTDCELIGPANLFIVGGSTIIGVTFGNCDVVVVRSGGPPVPIYNAIRFEDVEIYGGTVWNCTILIPSSAVDMFIEMNSPFITLTGRPEIDNPAPPEPAGESRP